MPQSRERIREIYAERRAQGICVECGKAPALPGGICCDPCLTRRKERGKRCQENKVAQRRSDGLCAHCGAALSGEDILQCLDCRRMGQRKKAEYMADYALQRKEAGLCQVCGKSMADEPPLWACAACRARKRVRELPHKPKRYAHNKEAVQKLKRAIFDAYGGSFCVCCGETHMEFLSIDHINGGGMKHRRELLRNERENGKPGKAINLYQWLKNEGYPSGFQVLCMNCNFAKGHFDCCPHEQERALSEVKA